MAISMRIPTSKEWDEMMDICKDDNALTHWVDIVSWVNDTEKYPERESFYRAFRGCISARLWDFNCAFYQLPFFGFRPVIEGLSSDFQSDEVAVVGTLYMNGEPVCVPSKPSTDGNITDYIPGTKLELKEALPDPAYQIKAIKIGNVYISDRVLLKRISYEDIVAAITTKED